MAHLAVRFLYIPLTHNNEGKVSLQKEKKTCLKMMLNLVEEVTNQRHLKEGDKDNICPIHEHRKERLFKSNAGRIIQLMFLQCS